MESGCEDNHPAFQSTIQSGCCAMPNEVNYLSAILEQGRPSYSWLTLADRNPSSDLLSLSLAYFMIPHSDPWDLVDFLKMGRPKTIDDIIDCWVASQEPLLSISMLRSAPPILKWFYTYSAWRLLSEKKNASCSFSSTPFCSSSSSIAAMILLSQSTYLRDSLSLVRQPSDCISLLLYTQLRILSKHNDPSGSLEHDLDLLLSKRRFHLMDLIEMSADAFLSRVDPLLFRIANIIKKPGRSGQSMSEEFCRSFQQKYQYELSAYQHAGLLYGVTKREKLVSLVFPWPQVQQSLLQDIGRWRSNVPNLSLILRMIFSDFASKMPLGPECGKQLPSIKKPRVVRDGSFVLSEGSVYKLERSYHGGWNGNRVFPPHGGCEYFVSPGLFGSRVFGSIERLIPPNPVSFQRYNRIIFNFSRMLPESAERLFKEVCKRAEDSFLGGKNVTQYVEDHRVLQAYLSSLKWVYPLLRLVRV